MRKTTAKQSDGNRSPSPDSRAGRARVLLAEDDREMRTLLSLVLRRAGYDVVECADGLSLLDQLTDPRLKRELGEIAVIISDVRMPGVTGLEILEGLNQQTVLPPVILITAFGDEQTHAEAKRLGAATTIDKPFDIDALLCTVKGIVSPS